MCAQIIKKKCKFPKPRPFNSYKEGIIDAAWDASVGYAHVVEVVEQGVGEVRGCTVNVYRV